MPALRARADDCCELCGGPIDWEAPVRSAKSASVDHVVPVHAGGHELPAVEELRLSHYGCNSARGNRTRRGRGLPMQAVVSAVEVEPDVAPRERDYEPAVYVQAPLFAVEEKNNSALAVDEIIFRDTPTRSFAATASTKCSIARSIFPQVKAAMANGR